MRALPLLLLGLVACGDKDGADDSAAGDPAIDAVLALTGDAANGATVFSSNCASCHGADGSGGSGPALAGHVAEHGAAHALEYIIYGDGGMPAFGDILSDQELADVVAHIETL